MREKGTSIPVLGLEAQPRSPADVRRPAAPAGGGSSLAFRVAAVVGAVVALVGWTDLAFAWFPLEWGNLEWEFGSSSRTFDGLPLSTMGVAAMAAAAVGSGSRRGTLIVLLFGALSLLLVIAAAALYWINVPPAWAAAPEPILASLKMAALRTSIFMVVYLVFYSWLTWFLWRGWRAFPSGGKA